MKRKSDLTYILLLGCSHEGTSIRKAVPANNRLHPTYYLTHALQQRRRSQSTTLITTTIRPTKPARVVSKWARYLCPSSTTLAPGYHNMYKHVLRMLLNTLRLTSSSLVNMILCSNDNTFGPRATCRNMDFTIKFEHTYANLYIP